MAYVPQSQDDEEKRRAEAGGGALGSFGSTQGAAAPTTPKFVNAADYLTKNPEGSAQIGNAVAGNLAKEGEAASSAVDAAGTKFNQDVSAGGTTLDQGLLNSALSNPTSFVQDPNNVAKFAALRDASYKGPSDLQGTDSFSDTSAKVSKLAPLATSIGTEEGRNALVQDLSPHPTQGKTALNQLLLQGNPANAQKISDVAGGFKNTEDRWNELLTNAPTIASQARAATDSARSAVQAGLGAAKDQFGNDINSAVTKANTDRDAYNKYSNDLGGAQVQANNVRQQLADMQAKFTSDPGLLGTISNNAGNPGTATQWQAQIKSLFDPSSWDSANIDPITSLHADPYADVPSAETVATPDQYAKESALEQLSGGPLDYLRNDQSNLAGTYHAPQAGTIPTLKDPSGQEQYMNDLLNFYKNPTTFATRPQGRDPKAEAQALLNANTPGNGVNLTPDDLATLHRLIAGSY